MPYKTALACLFALLSCGGAIADGIGLSAPLSGPSTILGAQMRDGALAAEAGIPVSLGDDACTKEGGAAVANQFVDAKVSVAVGYLCTEAIEAALPILKAAGIPVVAVGVRADSLTDRRDKTGWPVFRAGPRADAERNAAAAILTKLWRDDLFAIVDDGTIYGREMAETFRVAAELAALKPVFVDTYRPEMDNQIALVGRLRKAGATRVFVGGDLGDAAIMGRDAAKLGVPLTIAGGETLRGAPGDPTLPDGTLMIALPEWADVADKSAVEAIRARGAEPEGYALPAYAAVQIAAAAIRQAADTGKSAAQTLAEGTFATALGEIRFDAKGDLAQNPYRLFRFADGAFHPEATP